MDLRELRNLEETDAFAGYLADAIQSEDWTGLAYMLGRLDERATGYVYAAGSLKAIRRVIADVFDLAAVPRSASDYEPPEVPEELATARLADEAVAEGRSLAELDADRLAAAVDDES